MFQNESRIIIVKYNIAFLLLATVRLFAISPNDAEVSASS